MRPELVNHLDSVGTHIIRELDPDNGLFPKLLSYKVLTREQVERCQAKETRSNKVEEVLRCLQRCPDDRYENFCQVLVELGREDLVKLYLQPGLCTNNQPMPEKVADNRDGTHHVTKVNSKNGCLIKLLSDGVLTKEQVERCQVISFQNVFTGKHEMLRKYLEINYGLLPALRDKSVLIEEQIAEIDNLQTTKFNQKAVEALLRALVKRPDSDFVKFCECLVETNQGHIIKKLLE
jgi:hypothetical protein